MHHRHDIMEGLKKGKNMQKREIDTKKAGKEYENGYRPHWKGKQAHHSFIFQIIFGLSIFGRC